MNPGSENRIKEPVIKCGRCGKDHREGLIFKRFVKNPIVDNRGIIWDLWAICPETGDPILGRERVHI